MYCEGVNSSRSRALTQRAFVCTGPCPALSVNSLKYWGTDNPINRENPTTKILRVKFMFANCNIEMPVPTASHNKPQEISLRQCTRTDVGSDYRHSWIGWKIIFVFRKHWMNTGYPPTMPKVMQRIAATMGWGMEATTAPNFPGKVTVSNSASAWRVPISLRTDHMRVKRDRILY